MVLARTCSHYPWRLRSGHHNDVTKRWHCEGRVFSVRQNAKCPGESMPKVDADTILADYEGNSTLCRPEDLSGCLVQCTVVGNHYRRLWIDIRSASAVWETGDVFSGVVVVSFNHHGWTLTPEMVSGLFTMQTARAAHNLTHQMEPTAKSRMKTVLKTNQICFISFWHR